MTERDKSNKASDEVEDLLGVREKSGNADSFIGCGRGSHREVRKQGLGSDVWHLGVPFEPSKPSAGKAGPVDRMGRAKVGDQTDLHGTHF